MADGGEPSTIDRPSTEVPSGDAAGRGGPRRTRLQRLADALQDAPAGPKPSRKEFRESAAFVQKWQRNVGDGGGAGGRRLVVDVAGSHGWVAPAPPP